MPSNVRLGTTSKYVYKLGPTQAPRDLLGPGGGAGKETYKSTCVSLFGISYIAMYDSSYKSIPKDRRDSSHSKPYDPSPDHSAPTYGSEPLIKI